MPWEARMQKVFSLNELIAASENKLTIHTVKDYCRRGELHPCIYFEGNIVCIKKQRYQDSPIKSDPVAHIEEVYWSMIFKGYIHFSKLIDYLDPALSNHTDIFFNFDKVVEFITQPTVYAPLLPLSHNEYLKAFPRMIDDDIQEKRWLREASHFEGNPFRASEIVFHKEEIDTLLSNLKESKSETYNNTDDLTSLNKIEILASDGPLTDKNFYEIEIQTLTNEVKKLKDEIKMLNETAKISPTKEVEELKSQVDHAAEENQWLKDQIIKYKEKVDHNTLTYKHPCIDPFHPKFAPELELAIRVWEKKYINNYPTKHEDHSPAIDQILNEMEITNKRLIQRITVITNNKKLKTS